jgi:hypothetical protein
MMWLSGHATIAGLCMCMLLWVGFLGVVSKLERSIDSFSLLAHIK